MDLVNKIKTLKHNSDYRVSDVIAKSGDRWEHSGLAVLNEERYKGTILHAYLIKNGLYNPKNSMLLLRLIEKYIFDHKLPVPADDELVVHLRLGDAVVHNWFLSKNYIRLINQVKIKTPIRKITFVACFAYQEWSPESLHLKHPLGPTWEYTERKQAHNVKRVSQLFNSVRHHFPTLQVQVYSNYDIDQDLCYCVAAKHFIEDHGGFSKLMLELKNEVPKCFCHN